MKLKLELLSDSIAGSGEGISGMIDSDIQYDEYGIPYIPAKRIKGILRESALELRDIGIEQQSSIYALFGQPGSNYDGSLKIGNGYYEHYSLLRKFCHYARSNSTLSPIFSTSVILSYFTYLRTQTSLENGVAEKNTLRTIRTLRKNIIFFFEVIFSEKHKSLMENICKITRHFGMSRTRGFGEIKITIESIENSIYPSQKKKKELEKVEHDSEISLNNYALRYNIENFQSLLVCLAIGREVFSEEYIPGSTVLGAFATAFLKKFPTNDPAKDDCFRNLFLNGTVKFLNAYLRGKYDGRFIPIPTSIVEVKDTKEFLDLAHKESLVKICKKELQVQKLHGYVNQGFTKKTAPIMKIEYHHSRPTDNRTIGHASEQLGGEFFQYEAIAPNQNFQGIILGPHELLQNLIELIEDGCTWSLGKSRTAQYGQVRITYESCEVFHGECSELAQSDDEEISELSDNIWEPETMITVVLSSPMILLNSFGFPEPNPLLFIEELKTKINDTSIHLEKSFLKFTTIGGFMNKWGLPKQQRIALDAGSTLILKNTSNTSIPLSQIFQNSYGIRAEEGLGRIILYKPQEITSFENFKENEDECSSDEFSLHQEIISYALQKKLEISVKEEAIKKDFKVIISCSFINKLKAIVENSQDFDDLQKKLSLLKENSLNKLRKLNNMYLTISENSPRIEINQKEFCKILSTQNNSVDVRDLLKRIKKEEDYYFKSKTYFYYALYVCTYLNLLKWYNRRENHDQG